MKYKLSPSGQGIVPHAVVIEPYDPGWPVRAREIATQLRDLLQENLLEVEHIGSTAIPGLAAKPVIDLLPIVKDLPLLDTQKQRIEGLGYEWRGEFGIIGRRFCPLTSATGQRIVHLHFFQKDSAHILRHLAFRDYLLAHPTIVQEYEQEKRRAAALHPHDSFAYNDEKAGWVQYHEKEAMKWYIV